MYSTVIEMMKGLFDFQGQICVENNFLKCEYWYYRVILWKKWNFNSWAEPWDIPDSNA